MRFGGDWTPQSFFDNLIGPRLMEEILQHLRCIKPCKWWDICHTNWLARFLPSTRRVLNIRQSTWDINQSILPSGCPLHAVQLVSKGFRWNWTVGNLRVVGWFVLKNNQQQKQLNKKKTCWRKMLNTKNHGISSSWRFGDPRTLRNTESNPSFLEGPMILREEWIECVLWIYEACWAVFMLKNKAWDVNLEYVLIACLFCWHLW